MKKNNDSDFDTDLDDAKTGIYWFYFKGWEEFFDVLLQIDNIDHSVSDV